MRSVVKGNTNRCILVLFRTLLFSQVAVRNSTTIAPKFASMKADLYFVRHGETEANKHELIPSKEEPLNEVGHLQALRLAERVSNLEIDKLFCK